ncbi:hypothetical protein A28LD_2329 [Idiomarina sp. A28L]|uniref:hypothetical protein n=1 Tax=Idiomarina sp. A28L TaxID=1036674 RepID=UPI0002138687|nr:hypothetical protein [Idiomarina sp. A28L]EGN74189.1 hypothetical protein A28LD_2329 [Idiomarina sp. A28L]
MLSTGEYISGAVRKKHSIVIAVIGLSVSLLPSFGVQLVHTVHGLIFWPLLLIALSSLFFIYSGLRVAVNDIVLLKARKFNVGSLPSAIMITKNNDNEGARVILENNESIRIDKDVVVSICLEDNTHGQTEVALGVVLKQQDDGKIIIAANPKEAESSKWSEIINNPDRYKQSITITTCINRNYLDSDYLYRENYDVKALRNSVDNLDSDGVNKL